MLYFFKNVKILKKKKKTKNLPIKSVIIALAKLLDNKTTLQILQNLNKNKLVLSYITPLGNFSKKKINLKYNIYINIILFYFLRTKLITKFIIKKKKYSINNINILKSPNRHKKYQYNLKENLFKVEITLILEKFNIKFYDLLIVLKHIKTINLFEFNTLSLSNIKLILLGFIYIKI